MFAVLRKWMEYSKYRSSFEEILRLDILYANDDISYRGLQGPHYFGDKYRVFITRAADKGEAFLLPDFSN